MRLFGYYALHTFINQLKKLFKTWVLVFVVVCMVFGGLIGWGAATLADAVDDEQAEQAEIAEEPEEEEFALEIPGQSLMELIVGGVVLGIFFFEAVGADKNGSRIFLPADVNLLFASPMKPQSVLMFRLATQLGTAIFASIYLAFQLPNLILNLGLSATAAVAVLGTWVAAILIGKLIQVMLYTVCSTSAGFKSHLRHGIYAVIVILGAAFLAFYKLSGQSILVAADRFFNFPGSRLIPFWGWLKGLCAYAAEGSLGYAAICLAALALGGAAMVYGIWHLNADFYEDAMAKSEETAALMEKARSEKSTGVVAVKARKKDRKDSLRRDGMRHGWGANVFFFKTLYNRFRFAHLGFLTKTMETYFVVALGTAAVFRFGFGSSSELGVVLALGVFVFFRAMGNPLEEDTGMDFFRMIPESTWQKLLYSQLGGTVNCLLDLLLPMLAASILLPANPLKLLVWLPLIVSVDFYASSVVAFIDLSVPASTGKTIKQLVQILFIYFGLLPDIAILAVAIVTDHVAAGAVWSAVLNLALGVLFFSLASVFLQPKGRAHIAAAANQDLKAAAAQFSRLGFAVFMMIVIITVLQLAAVYAVAAWAPQLLAGSWGIWLVTFVPVYLVGIPAGLAIMAKVRPVRPEKKPLGFARGVKFFFICVFFMYGGNLVGNLVTTLIGMLRSTQVVNPLETYVSGGNVAIQIFFLVVLAPIIEEYVFRRQLIDRMRIYGGKTAVVMSALMFGLFHGNLSQFFYAFALGLAFGYIYLNTGKLRYTIVAHVIINFVGSILSVALLNKLSTAEVSSVWIAVYGIYVLVLIGGALVGLVLLCMNAGRLTFPAGELELPRGSRLRTSCMNPGILLAIFGSIVMILASLLV